MASSPPPGPLVALLLLAAGAGLVGLGTGVVPADPASVNAPGWVLAACGVVFGMGGVLMLTTRWPAVQTAAAGALWLAFGLIGAWVALFGEAEHFAGGTGWLAPAAEVGLARAVFGLGAVSCLAVVAWAAARLVRGGDGLGATHWRGEGDRPDEARP